MQLSKSVQYDPSSHSVPSDAGGLQPNEGSQPGVSQLSAGPQSIGTATQESVSSSQVAVGLQTSVTSLQRLSSPDSQRPNEQVSPSVQCRPSSHSVPSGAISWVQLPSAGLQTPAKQFDGSSHTVQSTGTPGRQNPPSQYSMPSQGLSPKHSLSLLQLGRQSTSASSTMESQSLSCPS